MSALNILMTPGAPLQAGLTLHEILSQALRSAAEPPARQPEPDYNAPGYYGAGTSPAPARQPFRTNGLNWQDVQKFLSNFQGPGTAH